jgi:hypothetical protein
VIALAPVAVTLAFSDGIGHAHLAGWYHDEPALAARVAFAVHPRVAIDTGVSEDLERIELGLHVGVRVRPTTASWFYVRGDVALVGASHLGSNYDLTGGAGAWLPLASWAAATVELDATARIGEVDTQALRLEVGVAITSAAFWTHI